MKIKNVTGASVLASLFSGFLAISLMTACQQTSVPETVDQSPDLPADETPDNPDPAEVAESSDSTALDSAESAKSNGESEPVVPTAVVSTGEKSPSSQVVPGDWNQWGGSSLRNNTPQAENIPIDWNIGAFDRKTGEWIKDKSKNIKWISRLGSQTYGNAVVSSGNIYVGTNNGSGHLKRYPFSTDLGCFLCFRESDGKFLWQHSNEKLPTGRVHDWEQQGVCSAALAEGDRVWYVSNRGHVVCLDAKGFYDDEDDGPVNGEMGRLFDLRKSGDPKADQVGPAVAGLNENKLTDAMRQRFTAAGSELPQQVEIQVVAAGKSWSMVAKLNGASRDFQIVLAGSKLSAFKKITPDDKDEADVVWDFDMMKELGVSQHNMCSCSVTSLGDILFVNTSNGVDESHINIPAPDAPSFFAMDKNTGEVFWTTNAPGLNILHGQWSSPAVAILGGVPQVLFSGGDGWLYSYRADRGTDGKPELLWKFDANPKTSKWIVGGRGTRNNLIATPVVHEGLVYIAVGQDPEHGEGVGHLWCIDPTKRGDVSPQLAVNVGDRSKTIPHRRLVAVVETEGEVAIDNPNSAVVWHYSQYDLDGDGRFSFEETMHRSCGTVAVKNDLLFISDFSGLFHCLSAKTGKVHWTYDMLAQAWGSPLIVENHVYIGDEDGDVCIFNLTAEPHEPIAELTLGTSVYSTPIVANGVMYISSKDKLFAIAKQDEAAE